MLPLSVIIVTHNHEQYIETCLASLLIEVKQVNGEIIVIDNLSDDSSARIVSRYPQVKLVVNKNRQGFSTNNNHGMALAKGRYLLLLNPDTEIVNGALKTLINFMEENPKVGLSGAQLLFPDGSIQPSSRRFPSLASTLIRRTPLRNIFLNSSINKHHLMLDIDLNQKQAVDWLLGACLCIRREVLDTVGPLDEGFYLYVEDIDWARRIQSQGWQVYYVPEAKIIHHHLARSDKSFFSWYTWIHFWSMVRYSRKYLLPTIPGLKRPETKVEAWNFHKSIQ
jgi:hypothetical protein